MNLKTLKLITYFKNQKKKGKMKKKNLIKQMEETFNYKVLHMNRLNKKL